MASSAHGSTTRGLPPPVGPSPYLEHVFPQGHHLMPAGARAQSTASSAQGWGEQTQDSSSLQPSQGFLFPTECAEQPCGCRGQEPCVLGVRQTCQVESRDLRVRRAQPCPALWWPPRVLDRAVSEHTAPQLATGVGARLHWAWDSLETRGSPMTVISPVA